MGMSSAIARFPSLIISPICLISLLLPSLFPSLGPVMVYNPLHHPKRSFSSDSPGQGILHRSTIRCQPAAVMVPEQRLQGAARPAEVVCELDLDRTLIEGPGLALALLLWWPRIVIIVLVGLLIGGR